MNQSGRYPRYRAPGGDRQVFCQPNWQSLPGLLQDDPRNDAISIGGVPLPELRGQARTEVLDAALQYTQAYADLGADFSLEGPIIATGHQPGLVHAGVWLKNFAAARLASQVNGVAVSLIIDSDLCRSNSAQVPTGSMERPRVEQVPFDEAMPQLPFEEREICDSQIWETFGDRAANAIAPLVPETLLREWWPSVVSRRDQQNLGQALSSGRHQLEISWGSKSMELPHSRVCRTEPFRRFALHILARADEFCTAYNSALADYRREHRLRNRAHPVPDLHREDDWIETPFWIWSSHDPRRQGLFVRRAPEGLELSDRGQFANHLPLQGDGDLRPALEKISEWEQRGIKLRTRALLTTMFARLVLSDVFIHGIGGAKYDQVTNHICEDFFNCRLPDYVTLTGTLHLPISHASAEPQQHQQLRSSLRRLRYHPEVEIERSTIVESRRAEFDKLSAEKSHWIQTEKTHANCAERHKAINTVNEALQEFAAPRRAQLEDQLAAQQTQQQQDRILNSREYSFCLFPRAKIRDFLLDFPSFLP